jgi:hypothetical protein
MRSAHFLKLEKYLEMKSRGCALKPMEMFYCQARIHGLRLYIPKRKIIRHFGKQKKWVEVLTDNLVPGAYGCTK